jgi:threonine/homoserine/homoserine lactone efflux protein
VEVPVAGLVCLVGATLRKNEALGFSDLFRKPLGGVIAMSIFETMGLVLTSSLATVGLFYLAYVGLKALLKKEVELPREVKEMFRIAK